MSTMDVSQIVIDVEENQIVAYCNFASLTVLVYDYLLTLGQETTLVWHTPWSLGKVLFFATRYSAFLDGTILPSLVLLPSSVSPVSCSRIYVTVVWLVIIGIFLSEMVLVFRTWAIWGRNSKMAISLLVFGVSLAVPICLLAHFGLANIQFAVSPVPQVGCWLKRGVSRITFAAYTLLLLFESVILVLTVIKGRQLLRYGNSSLLLLTLYRDGVLYYFFLLLCTIANIVVAGKAMKPGPSLQLMQRVMHSIVAARILLNLRQAISLDRANRVATGGGAEGNEASFHRTRTALSSVVIGVDTWFREEISETDRTTMVLE